MQIDAFCRSQQDVKVVGYYHANELLTDLDLKPIARKMAERIQQQQGHAVTLLVTFVLAARSCLWQDTKRMIREQSCMLAQVDNGKLGAFADNASQDILQVGLRSA